MFNLGALAGGVASGIETGSTLADQQLQRQLRNAQLNSFNAQNLGQQAFTNALIPGMVPMPQQQPQQQGSVLSRMPIVGDAGRMLGLWGDVPQTQPVSMGMPPMPQQAPRPPVASSGGMPAQPPMQTPPPQAMGGAQPPMENTVAIAIDKANPGLRQSNPAAFAEAVKLGVQYAREQAAASLDTRYKEAQISGMGSENKLRDAQVESIPLDRDIKRADLDNKRAETDVRKAEIDFKRGPEADYKRAQIAHEKAKQDAVQAELRIKEAEQNAKSGDYDSQREWRDAQIADIRAKRMLQMSKDKMDKLKTQAEIDKMATEGTKNLAQAENLVAKTEGKLPGDQQKAINSELTKAQVQLRHHENEVNRLITSINPADPKVRTQVDYHNKYVAQYKQRVQDLESQLSTAPKKEETPKVEVPPARQTELEKLSQKFVELGRANNVEGGSKLVQLMRSKGIPEHEINWALERARELGKTAPVAPPPPTSGPQIPQWQ